MSQGVKLIDSSKKLPLPTMGTGSEVEVFLCEGCHNFVTFALTMLLRSVY